MVAISLGQNWTAKPRLLAAPSQRRALHWRGCQVVANARATTERQQGQAACSAKSTESASLGQALAAALAACALVSLVHVATPLTPLSRTRLVTVGSGVCLLAQTGTCICLYKAERNDACMTLVHATQ